MTKSRISLNDGLELKYYDPERMPSRNSRRENLPHGFPVSRLCVLRGIRYDVGFASELRGLAQNPEFTRAARSIMSNVIADISSDEEIPYCIWHHDVPRGIRIGSTDALPCLLSMRCGRIWKALLRSGEFTEVSIAEKARDNQKSGCLIFDLIMAQPVKYAVDDYTQSVNLEKPRLRAQLNGGMVVPPLLQVQQKHVAPLTGLLYDGHYCPAHDERHYFNITEDCNMDEYESKMADDRHKLCCATSLLAFASRSPVGQ